MVTTEPPEWLTREQIEFYCPVCWERCEGHDKWCRTDAETLALVPFEDRVPMAPVRTIVRREFE